LHRFFLRPGDCDQESRPPLPLSAGDTIEIKGDLARRLRSVLRCRVGDSFVLIDPDLSSYPHDPPAAGRRTVLGLGPGSRDLVAQALEVKAGSIRASIQSLQSPAPEPRPPVYLAAALLKGDHFEMVLQKCTELGVCGFIPLATGRTVVRSRADRLPRRLDRWQRIVEEACEQSGRARVPVIDRPRSVPGLMEICREMDSWLAWEELAAQEWTPPAPPSRSDRPLLGIVGPEGGWEREEVDLLRRAGVCPVSLGPRLLKAETASIVLSCLMLYRREAPA